MTVLALVSYVCAALVVALALMFGAPAISRQLFQIRMVRIAIQIDEHIDREELPRHAFVLMLRLTSYVFAEGPEHASLRSFYLVYKAVSHHEYASVLLAAQDSFDREALSSERFIAQQIQREIGRLVLIHSFRNSILWLPLWFVPAILLRAGERGDSKSKIKQVETAIVHPPVARTKELAGV